MPFWNFVIAHWGFILSMLLLLLKWIYNAWTVPCTFAQFVRQFIGEIVQEQPPQKLTLSQVDTLSKAGMLAPKDLPKG